MLSRPHSHAFVSPSDQLLTGEESGLARLARFFRAITERYGPLGPPLPDAVRAIAELDDDDLERLAV